jgi:hypothetical protein
MVGAPSDEGFTLPPTELGLGWTGESGREVGFMGTRKDKERGSAAADLRPGGGRMTVGVGAKVARQQGAEVRLNPMAGPGKAGKAGPPPGWVSGDPSGGWWARAQERMEDGELPDAMEEETHAAEDTGEERGGDAGRAGEEGAAEAGAPAQGARPPARGGDDWEAAWAAWEEGLRERREAMRARGTPLLRPVVDLEAQVPTDWEAGFPVLFNQPYYRGEDPDLSYLRRPPPVRGQANEGWAQSDPMTISKAYQCYGRQDDVYSRLMDRIGWREGHLAAPAFRTYATLEERKAAAAASAETVVARYMSLHPFREERARQWRQLRREMAAAEGTGEEELPERMGEAFVPQLHKAVSATLAGHPPVPLLTHYIEMRDAQLRLDADSRRGVIPPGEAARATTLRELNMDCVTATDILLKSLWCSSELSMGEEGLRVRKAMAVVHARHRRAQMGLLRAAKGDADYEVTKRFVLKREKHLDEVDRLQQHTAGLLTPMTEEARAAVAPVNRAAARRKIFQVMVMDAMAVMAAHEWLLNGVRPVWDSDEFRYIAEWVPVPPKGRWRDWSPDDEVDPVEGHLEVVATEAQIAADKLAFANHMAALRIRRLGGEGGPGRVEARAPVQARVDLSPAAVLRRMKMVYNTVSQEEKEWAGKLTMTIAASLAGMRVPERIAYDSSEWTMGKEYRFTVVGMHPALLNENTYQLRQDIQTSFRFVGIDATSVVTRPPLPGSTAKELPFSITAVMGPQLLSWKAGELAVYCGTEPHRTRLYGFYEGEEVVALGAGGMEFELWTRGLFAARPDLHPAQVMMLLHEALVQGLTVPGEEPAVFPELPRWVFTTRAKVRRGPGRPPRDPSLPPDRRRVYVNPRERGTQIEVPFRDADEAREVADTSQGGGMPIHLVLPANATGPGAYRAAVQLRNQVEKDKRRSWGEGRGPVFFIIPTTGQLTRLLRGIGAPVASAGGLAAYLESKTRELSIVGASSLVGYRVQETSTGKYDLGYIPVVWEEGAEKVAEAVFAMFAYKAEQGQAAATSAADGTFEERRAFDPLGIQNGLSAEWEVTWDRTVMDEDIYFANNSDTPMSDGKRVTRTTGSTGSSSRSDTTEGGRAGWDRNPRAQGGRLAAGFRLGQPDGCPPMFIDPGATVAEMGPIQTKLTGLLEAHGALHLPAYTYGGEDPSPPHIWQHIPTPEGVRDGRRDFPELLEKRDLIYTAIQSLVRGGGARIQVELQGWVLIRRGSSKGALGKIRRTGGDGSAGGGGRQRR